MRLKMWQSREGYFVTMEGAYVRKVLCKLYSKLDRESFKFVKNFLKEKEFKLKYLDALEGFFRKKHAFSGTPLEPFTRLPSRLLANAYVKTVETEKSFDKNKSLIENVIINLIPEKFLRKKTQDFVLKSLVLDIYLPFKYLQQLGFKGKIQNKKLHGQFMKLIQEFEEEMKDPKFLDKAWENYSKFKGLRM